MSTQSKKVKVELVNLRSGQTHVTSFDSIKETAVSLGISSTILSRSYFGRCNVVNEGKSDDAHRFFASYEGKQYSARVIEFSGKDLKQQKRFKTCSRSDNRVRQRTGGNKQLFTNIGRSNVKSCTVHLDDSTEIRFGAIVDAVDFVYKREFGSINEGTARSEEAFNRFYKKVYNIRYSARKAGKDSNLVVVGTHLLHIHS